MSERIHGGNATVHVSSMDRAVDFYSDKLGLGLALRIDDEWAEIDAGDGFVIGLRTAGSGSPTPGAGGAVSVCLQRRRGPRLAQGRRGGLPRRRNDGGRPASRGCEVPGPGPMGP